MGKKPARKGNVLYDSFYMKCPQYANMQSLKTDQCLSGTGRGEKELGVTANDYRISFWNDENLLILDSGDGGTDL